MSLNDEATKRRLEGEAASMEGRAKRKPRDAAQKEADARRAKARRAAKGGKPRGEKATKPAKASKPKTRSARIRKAMTDAEAAGLDVQDWAKKVRGKRAALEKAEAAKVLVSKQCREALAQHEAAFAEIVMHVPEDSAAPKHNASIRVAYAVVGETKAENAETKSIAKKRIRDAQKAFDRLFESVNQPDLPGVD